MTFLGATLGSVLGGLAALHAYWATGGDWGVRAALGGRDPAELGNAFRVASAAVAALLVCGAFIVVARAAGSLDSWAIRWGVWGVAVALVVVALVNVAGRTQLERFGFVPFALVLALLTVLVARS